MAEERTGRGQFANAARRGAGWAVGASVVFGAASMLRGGGRSTLKGALVGFVRARGAAAEGVERLRDVYAEAQHDVRSRSDAADPPAAG